MVAEREETELIPLDQRALAEFSVTPEQITARVEEFKDLHLITGDPKSYKQVKGAYLILVHLRNGVDKRRKELGEEARRWTSALSAAAKKLLDPTGPLEARLKAEIDAEDARIAAKEQERVDQIKWWINEIIVKMGIVSPATPASELKENFLSLFELDIDDSFMEFKEEAQSAKDRSISLLKDGIAKREAWEKDEADRKAESERLKKQREEQEAEAKRLADEKRKLDEEKARIEAEKKEAKAKEEAKAKAEADAKAKAEREAKEAEEKTKREALEKAEQERKAKEAAENAERMQPDKKKIISFVNGILDHPRPEIKEKEAKAMFAAALNDLRVWAGMIIEEADKL